MSGPDFIYLIDTGDQIAWCDDPAPGPNDDPNESVAYVRASIWQNKRLMISPSVMLKPIPL